MLAEALATMLLLLLLVSGEASAQSLKRLSVMSFNVHGGNSNQYHGSGCDPAHMPVNMERFKRVIQSNGASVVIINEIHKRQGRDLARRLGYPDPDFVWTKICNSRNRDLDYGNAILSRYRLTERRYYDLHTAAPDRTREEYTRLSAATISVRGRRVRIFNTHLTASGDESDQNLQVEGILRFVPQDEAFAGAGRRSILGGDLNFIPFSNPYQKLVTLGIFRDAWAEWNSNLGTGATIPAAAPRNRIDYVLLRRSSGFHVEQARVVDICSGHVCLSDHRPVLVRLTFR
jgi:endonuclease/exonuclease/phosphatase family metal-dependent hydrolase